MLNDNLPLCAEAFWQFSLQWYSQQRVATASLALQDEHGLNVNMLLLLAWCTQQQLLLGAAQWTRLAEAIKTTEQMLSQHRRARKTTKVASGATSEVYQQMKAQELTLEREQQRDLIEALSKESLTPASDRESTLAGFIKYAMLSDNLDALALIKTVCEEDAGSSSPFGYY